MRASNMASTASQPTCGRASGSARMDEVVLQDHRRASWFAFLSEYEGFGLTPIEALASGVAPVVLDTAVAHEIYGNAARYVGLGPDTRADLGRVLVELLGQPAARAALLSHRSEVLSRYDWSRTAAATLAALEEAAGAR
jgi:glycosyltransferase involved in cell wall biosynthesis